MKAFVTATNVHTGRGRIFRSFRSGEITPDVLLASACLPTLFHAVEIEGESYWGGGYAGNPTITPLVRESHAHDTILVQINPRERPNAPCKAKEILNLVSVAVATNVLAALTGSASGGLTIALDVLDATYLQRAAEIGLDPGLLHRVAVIGSGTLDTLPHNGAVVTLLAICGTTHRESYGDIAVAGIVGPIISLAAVIVLGSFLGSFLSHRRLSSGARDGYRQACHGGVEIGLRHHPNPARASTRAGVTQRRKRHASDYASSPMPPSDRVRSYHLRWSRCGRNRASPRGGRRRRRSLFH